MKKTKKLPDFFINAFYETKFRDNLFIVKASGAVIQDKDARDMLMANIRDLIHHGIKVILVYGGGNAIDIALKERGIDVQKNRGRRITDRRTMSVIREVIGGDLALRVYESMHCNALEGLPFNAVPTEWMRVTLRDKEPINFGRVGEIQEIFPRPILRQLAVNGFIACPCLTMSEEDVLCNINADTIATQLAIGLSADKIVFMSDVDGVQISDKTAEIITAEQIPGFIADGTVTEGMAVKMENCLEALNEGVKRIHLINGLRENALYKEIFESVGPGTMLLREEERENYLNEVEVQKAIGGKS